MIRSASATVRQSGFSQATCLPARSSVEGQRRVMRGRRRHERHLDVVVAGQVASRRVGPHAREVRLRRFPALDVRIDDGDQLDALASASRRARGDSPCRRAGRSRRWRRRCCARNSAGRDAARARGTGPARACGAPRPCCRDRTRPRVPPRAASPRPRRSSRRATLTSTMTLPRPERHERHEAVDHRELARDSGGEVRVRLGDPRVVLAGRRLGGGHHAEQIGPEPVALRRRRAERHQRRPALDGGAHRGEELDRQRRAGGRRRRSRRTRRRRATPRPAPGSAARRARASSARKAARRLLR